VNAESLRRAIEYEIMGKGQQRGLTQENPNLQTFEIYMPYQMLKYYKELYYAVITVQISNAHDSKLTNQNDVMKVLYRKKALPANVDLSKLSDPGAYMNRIMQQHIENARIDSK
jgi:hypothetical protein